MFGFDHEILSPKFTVTMKFDDTKAASGEEKNYTPAFEMGGKNELWRRESSRAREVMPKKASGHDETERYS